MNKWVKYGAIINVVASVCLFIGAILYLVLGGIKFLSVSHGMALFLGISSIIFAVVNGILAVLILMNHEGMILPLGILSIVTLLVGWCAWIFPIVIFIVSAILLFMGRSAKLSKSEKYGT